MKLSILVLLCSLTGAFGQNFLYTTNRETAVEFCTLLDNLCGYPNPATLTYHAVEMQESKTDKGEVSYSVIIPDVYAPKIGAYLDAAGVIPTATKAVPVIDKTTDVAAALDAAAKAAPSTEKDKMTSVVFVVITVAVKEEMAKAAELVKAGDPIKEAGSEELQP